MQISDGWSWGVFDFVFAFMLLSAAGLAFEWVLTRSISSTRKVLFGIAIFVVLALIWVEAAVGIIIDAPTQEVSTDIVTRSGIITQINLDQAALDGPYMVTIQAVSGEFSTIAVPSMGLPLCVAYKNNTITDVYALKLGQQIEVRGTLGENDSIVPCASADHYLRVVSDVATVPTGTPSLTSKPWKWVSALYNDGTEIKPKKPDAFVLTFKSDGTFGASTDCNGVGGKYSIGANSTITFSDMISTLMYCEGSNEQDFTKILSTTSGYHFGPAGELVLDLKFDSGTAVFK